MTTNISDKNRTIELIEDAEWHPLTFKLADGQIVKAIGVGEGIPAGTYLLQYQLRGEMIAAPNSIIEFRVQRYPIDVEDAGTGYDYIDPFKRVIRDLWFGTRHAKVEIRATGDYSRKIGIDYRLRGGRLTNTSRVLKFIPQ